MLNKIIFFIFNNTVIFKNSILIIFINLYILHKNNLKIYHIYKNQFFFLTNINLSSIG